MTCIVVAFQKLQDAQNIKNILVRSGLNQVSVCSAGANVLAALDGYESGIVICGYRLADMAYMQLKEDLPQGFEMVLIASRKILVGGLAEGVNFLETPFNVHELLDTIRYLEDQNYGSRKNRRDLPKRRTPEEMHLIQTAKEVLIKKNHISEDEAHKYLLKQSMECRRNLVETARMVLQLNRE